jgi:hypothetical protein
MDSKQVVVGNLTYTCSKRMKLDPYFTPYKKIEYRSQSTESYKIEVNLYELWLGSGFLNVTPKAQLKRKQNERNQTHKLDYTK